MTTGAGAGGGGAGTGGVGAGAGGAGAGAAFAAMACGPKEWETQTTPGAGGTVKQYMLALLAAKPGLLGGGQKDTLDSGERC